jgi:hypothetical protein
LKFGSSARLGLEASPSVVILDDFESEAESQSGSFADVLGGEERIEDFSHDVIGDAVFVVREGEGEGRSWLTLEKKRD